MSLTPQQLTTMIQRTLALLALALFALVGQAQSLSPAQVTALRTNILATDTVKGAALLCRSTAGTAPSTTGGDKAVANGDTLNVTYTASA